MLLVVEPSTEYEILRRRLYNNVLEMWYFVTTQISDLQPKLIKSAVYKEKYTNFLNMVSQYKRYCIENFLIIFQNVFLFIMEKRNYS